MTADRTPGLAAILLAVACLAPVFAARADTRPEGQQRLKQGRRGKALERVDQTISGKLIGRSAMQAAVACF